MCFNEYTKSQVQATSFIGGGRSNNWKCGEVDTLEVVAVAAPPPAVESGRLVEVEVLALSQEHPDTTE